MKALASAVLTSATLLAALFAPTAGAAYVTGFEEPVFTPGVISGQDGWTTPEAVAHTARVLTAPDIEAELANAGLNPARPVHGGSQALVVGGAGGSSATIRQVPGLESTSPVVLDFRARPLTGGNIGNVFVTMEDAAGTRAAAVRFGPTTIDYGTTVAGIWQSTGLAWSPEEWYQFTLTPDYQTRTYDFAVNGTPVNTEPIPFYNALSENLSQIRVFRGSNQAGMIVDDLSVAPVPEPSAAATVTLGAAAALLRRRRRT